MGLVKDLSSACAERSQGWAFFAHIAVIEKILGIQKKDKNEMEMTS